MPSTMPRLIIGDTSDNWDRWGKLIMTWATGTNYLGDTHTYTTPDHLTDLDRDKFEQEVSWARVDLRVISDDPDWKVNVTQYTTDSKTVAINLPSPEQVAQAEANVGILSSAEGPYGHYGGHLLLMYPLPCFYKQAFPSEQASFSCAEVRPFFHARIGEYTVNNCQ